MTDLSRLQSVARPRPVRSPRGSQLSCKQLADRGGLPHAPEQPRPRGGREPDALVVYGGIGKAARDWDCFEADPGHAARAEPDETLLVQSGKPVGVFRTHEDAPRVLIANSNLVPKWATGSTSTSSTARA
jgi:urocanate hydratase